MKTPAEIALHEAVLALYAEWRKSDEFEENSTAIVRDWILVVGGVGWDSSGEEIESVMITPNGPYYALRGLVEGAADRLAAESLAGYSDDDG